MILLKIGVGKIWAGPFFPPPPPLQNVTSFLSLCLYNLFTVSELSWLKYFKEKFKFTNFAKCLAIWFFEKVGWGKTRPAHSFPPLLFSNLSIYLSVFRFNLLLHCIWTLMIVLSQGEFKLRKHLANCMFLLSLNVSEHFCPKWELSFLTYTFIGTSTLWGGERLGRPILSHPPKCLDLSIYCLVFRFMLLFDCIWTILNDLFQREIKFLNQQVNWYFYIVGWGKLGRPILSPLQNVPIFLCILSVFWIMQLFECIWTLLNDLFQSEN